MNIYEELEKKEYGFTRYDDGKEIKRVFEIEEIKRAISSAREELLNAIDKQESPLWIMDDFGEPTRINTIYLKIKINSVLGGEK